MKKILIFLVLVLGLSLSVSSYAQRNYNYTNNIKIEIKENKNLWKIDYTITHTFDEMSKARRGIFYDINKNQDGVLYDFALESNPTIDGNIVKHEVISEINSFRVRFGDQNILVPAGTYVYQFSINTKTNPDYNHSFAPFYDWKDPLDSVNIIYKGEDICSQGITDCKYNPLINLNDGKPRANTYFSYFQILQSYIWVVLASIIAWFGFLKSKFRDPYRYNFTPRIPYFSSPKNMLPWDIESIISKGELNTKNTLAAYILYLNHQKIIQVIQSNSVNKNVKINILQVLPLDMLPLEYNNIIKLMAELGVQEGLKESKVEEFTLDNVTQDYVLKKNNSYYTTKPELYPFTITFITMIIGSILGLILYYSLRTYILIGISTFVFYIFCFFVFLIIQALYLTNKDKFNQAGYEIFKEATGYKYYITSIEKEKLDFDNNPEEGAKFYLANVPYAAQFGELKKFNKYFQSLDFIKSESITTGVLLSSTLSYSSFYVAPSNTSGGSSGGNSGGGFSGGGGSW